MTVGTSTPVPGNNMTVYLKRTSDIKNVLGRLQEMHIELKCVYRFFEFEKMIAERRSIARVRENILVVVDSLMTRAYYTEYEAQRFINMLTTASNQLKITIEFFGLQQKTKWLVEYLNEQIEILESIAVKFSSFILEEPVK